MYKLKKVLICVLVLLFCLSMFTACGTQPEPIVEDPNLEEPGTEEQTFTQEDWSRVVATFGDHSLTSAMFSYYYWASYTSFLDYYGGDTQQILDLYTPLDQQMYSEELTWQDFFIDNALMAFKQYCVLNDLAEADGFELSETAQNTLANAEEELTTAAEGMGFGSIEEYLIGNYGTGATLENYLEYMRGHFVVREYTAEIQNRFTFTDEEIEAYYDEHAEEYAAKGVEKIDVNMAQLRYMMILPADETEESYNAIDATFNEMLADWETWEDKSEQGFMSFGEKWSEQGFAQDYLDAVAPGTVYFTNFDSWLFEEPREPGDTRTYYMDSGDYFFYYLGETEDVYWQRQTAYDLSYDSFTTFMLDEINTYEYEVFPENIIIAQAEDLYAEPITEEDLMEQLITEE